jgi:hypothetical protein
MLLGLIVGAAAVGISSGRLAGGDGATAPAAVTRTVTSTMVQFSTATTTVGPTNGISTVTATITAASSQRRPSMDLEATQLLYFQGETVTLVGTVYPPPPSSTGIALTTRNPLGVVVQVGQAETGITNGTFFYLLSTATSANWISGKYLANASVSGQSATATFIYTASPSPRGPLLSLQVLAPPVVSAGQQVSIAILTSFPNGTLDDVTSWSTFAVLFPDGTFHNLCTPGALASTCTGTFGRIHAGFYQLVFALPGTARSGTYYVEAAGSDSSGNSPRGAGQFSVP